MPINKLMYKSGEKKGKRRYKDGKPGWEIRVSIGELNYQTGTYERVSRTFYGTKKEAEREERRIKSDLEKGIRVKKQSETFSDFARAWHQTRIEAGKLAETSKNREATIVNTLCSYLGTVKLKDITPAMVERTYSDIRRDKSAALGHQYSESTMSKIHIVFSQIMKRAVLFDLIDRNPCERIEAPKCSASERRSLSKGNAIRLHDLLASDEAAAQEKMLRLLQNGDLDGHKLAYGLSSLSNICAVRFILATGVRRGEAFGLQWGSIDFKEVGGRLVGIVRVRQSLNANGNIVKTKTAAGNRALSMDSATAESLLALKEIQAREIARLGLTQTNETPVFCSCVGGWPNLQNFERWWRKWREENGFAGLKIHELRHTQATQLLANGVDVKTVQTRLGHANAAITLNWYAHAIPENDYKASALIGDLFASGDNQPKKSIGIA